MPGCECESWDVPVTSGVVWVKVSEHDGRVAYMPKYPAPEVVVPESKPACGCCCHLEGPCIDCGEPK